MEAPFRETFLPLSTKSSKFFTLHSLADNNKCKITENPKTIGSESVSTTKINISAIHFSSDDTFALIKNVSILDEKILRELYEECGLDLDLKETRFANLNPIEYMCVSPILNLKFEIIKEHQIENCVSTLLKIAPIMTELENAKELIGDFCIKSITTPKENENRSFDITLPEIFTKPVSSISPCLTATNNPNMAEFQPFCSTASQLNINNFATTNNSIESNPICSFSNAFSPFKIVEMPKEPELPVCLSKTIIVIFNHETNTTLTRIFDSKTRSKNQEIRRIINEYPIFGFKILFEYESKNTEELNHIESKFHRKTFFNSDELQRSLDLTAKYIQFLHESSSTESFKSENAEQTIITKFITSYFSIDNNPEHKFKASELFELISSKRTQLDIHPDTNFRNRLSKYLQSMGLQKKRMSDGYYYYGLVEKEDFGTSNKINKIQTNFVNQESNKKECLVCNILSLEKERYLSIHTGIHPGNKNITHLPETCGKPECAKGKQTP